MSADDSSSDVARTKDELDVERHFLGTTVRLSDGTEGLVFSRGIKNESNFFLYNCHLCGVPNLPGERCLQTHIAGRKHQTKLSQPVIDAVAFRAPLVQKTKIQMNIAPGEPVPPGFENEVKPMAEIQPLIDVYKEGALIGIEYSLEIVDKTEREPSYLCILCDKKGDPRTVFSHWTSYNHRLKYLEKHFPAVIKELVPYRYNPDARNIMPRLVQMIVEAVEDHHGRLSPTVCDIFDFKRNRNKIIQEIISEKHFDEKSGPTFVNVIDKRTIDDLIKSSKGAIAINIDVNKKRDPSPPNVKAPKRLKSESIASLRKARDSLDSISSDSSTELNRVRDHRSSKSPSSSRRKLKAQSPAYRIIPRVQRSPPFDQVREHKEKKSTLPTPKELSKQASEIAQERYKWEKYRCLVEIAVKDLEKVLKEHEKNPEKHPLYPEEWKKFWNRRYKELQAEKKDPNKHDFKPEWIVFWTKRMKELHEEDVEKKKTEIKKKLGLPENAEEKTDQLKQQYKIKAPAKPEKSHPQVIDISDEESISSHSHSKSKKNVRSISRSLSPLSEDEFEKKPKRYYSREYERGHSREKYSSSTDYYRHASYSRSYYGSTSSHYGYRTMDSYSYPQYEPPPKEEEEEDNEPLTVVAVLRLLTALEDHLGSLGPKVVDLLAKALALEKVKANSADEMLLNEDNSVFFETVKEKLKGQLIANVLDSHKIKAVKKAIKNIAAVIHQVNEKASKKEEEQSQKEEPKEVKKPKITKDLPFDRQLIASKLAASLVMQEKTDISTEDMDRLIHAFILMVKVSKERGETVYVKDMLSELGILSISTEDEDVQEVVEEEDRDDKENISLDMFDVNEDEIEEESTPQTASGALESLTDSDLQTLLQNFKHLSTEEQHHLIAHLKKLESTDPIRVEKLRKFVDVSNVKTETESQNSIPKSNTGKNSPNKKTTSVYSDDEEEKLQKIIDSDDDDDDYNFEDVVKIASNNVKEKQDEAIRREESANREREGELSNMSRSSATSATNLNMSLANTQSLIANLMGSLQKNNSNFTVMQNNPSNSGNMNNIPTLVSRPGNERNPTLPFYQQQQPQSQLQQNSSLNQQNQNQNLLRSNTSNNMFVQDNFNQSDNIQGQFSNQQNFGNNFNFSQFLNLQQQQQQQQQTKQILSNQTTQILQDFIAQQQNFRAQRHQMEGNF